MHDDERQYMSVALRKCILSEDMHWFISGEIMMEQ